MSKKITATRGPVTIKLELDDYQAVNLRELLRVACHSGLPLGTGDWAWELKQALEAHDFGKSTPNTPLENQIDDCLWAFEHGRIKSIL